MQLYPAIDMKGGKCVRLTQGLFDNVKVYSDTPADMAKLWFDGEGIVPPYRGPGRCAGRAFRE